MENQQYGKKMKNTVTIYLDDTQKAHLSSLAKKEGRSLNYFIVSQLPQPKGKNETHRRNHP
jgi:predicted transcriptional regulator